MSISAAVGDESRRACHQSQEIWMVAQYGISCEFSGPIALPGFQAGCKYAGFRD
jgi:hypothetical protein